MTPRARSWEDAPDKEWDLRNMEVYAAMVDALDQGVGRIVKALKDSGHFENTLFIFIADNGGCAENMGRRKGIQYRDKDPEKLKPMGKDELQLDMIPRRTRDGRVVKQGTDVMTGGADTITVMALVGQMPVTLPSASISTGYTKEGSVLLLGSPLACWYR